MPLTDIYEMFSESVMLLSMILCYHYIYMEPGFVRRRSVYIFAGSFLAVIIGLRMIPGRPEAAEFLCPLAFFCLYVLLTRKKKRLRGMFLFLPISGYLFMLVAASTSFYCVFTGARSSEGFNYAMDAAFCLALLVFWKRGRRFREQVKSQREYRSLSRGERWLLNLGGVFVFFMAVILIGMLENVSGYELDGGWRILFLMTGSISIALLAVAVIAFVMQGSKKEYYQREAQLTERYLKAELEHFKAYRQAQQEVRRVRHDMKNHYAVLSVLAGEEKNDEIRAYLAQLGKELARSEVGLQCGNDIADAILNEKNRRAKQLGAAIKVEGRLSQDCGIDMLDICTIFSNALDNALEYLEQSELTEKWIRVKIAGQGSMWLFRCENPVQDDARVLPSGITGKGRAVGSAGKGRALGSAGKGRALGGAGKGRAVGSAGKDRAVGSAGKEYASGTPGKDDAGWHGFGTMNMERAAEKYMGYIKRNIEEGAFILEAVLFTTKQDDCQKCSK